MINNRVVTLGALSGFVIIGGIIFAILMAVLLDDLQSSLWALGFLYVLPGILGLIAALVHNRIMYIITLAFNILFLLAMFIVMVFLGSGMRNATEPCSKYESSCKQQPRSIYIAMFVFVVITWIVLFMAVIICSYNTCAGNMTTPGVVMQSGPQTNISVSQVSQQQNSQLNPNPMNTVPAYGGPQYGPYVHGAPQYGPYWYGAPNGQTGHSAPNGQNMYSIPPYGQNGSEAPDGQKAQSDHQQNNTATDTASAAEVHPLQDITKTNN